MIPAGFWPAQSALAPIGHEQSCGSAGHGSPCSTAALSYRLCTPDHARARQSHLPGQLAPLPGSPSAHCAASSSPCSSSLCCYKGHCSNSAGSRKVCLTILYSKRGQLVMSLQSCREAARAWCMVCATSLSTLVQMRHWRLGGRQYSCRCRKLMPLEARILHICRAAKLAFPGPGNILPLQICTLPCSHAAKSSIGKSCICLHYT